MPAYEIAGELGRGAFGVVYEARHTQLGRQVAVKQLPQSFAENQDVRERFVAEAQMVASLEHPHIVPVYDFVESEGARFLIMERCAGSVGDQFKEEGIVTDEACAAVLACLAALDFAHAKGLLHRDVKPENLMYDTKGVVKLADFGIARDLGVDTRRTATGMIVGTPAYMSPEQCRGDDLTPASDVYSVAMMGYELLTGALPFPETNSVNGLLAHHLVTTPAPLLQTRPELPGVVGEVIDTALAKDLTVRYSTAEEFATALARACVTAFGSGWLRRRRFVLHWAEIIAETERPDSNSPRTGTITVKAGDLAHAVAALEDEIEPVQGTPTPVAVVGNADAPTLPPEQTPAQPPAPSAAPQPVAAPQPAAPAPPVSRPEPTADFITAPEAETEKSSPNLMLIGGIAAAIIAAVVAFMLLSGDSGETGLASQPLPTSTVAAAAPVDDGVAEQDVEPSPEPLEEPTPEPTPEPLEEPTPEPTPEPTALAFAGEPQPFVLGSNDLPIMNSLPLEYNDIIVDSPWQATPCPLDQERVACIFGAITVDEENGALEVPWFTLGFTPELEPADYHLHFYIPELVDGDENKAGNAVTGGAWRLWDGPWPATSFGGDNGRTLYTLADFASANSSTLCVAVAQQGHGAVPGSGNCAPVARVDEQPIYQQMVNRLEGQWVGNCSTKAMAIAPKDWRWYNLNEQTPAEVAAIIRPASVADTTALLEQFVAEGGVVWAEGPAQDNFVVNYSLSVTPGQFGLNDTPGEVAEEIARLGFDTSTFASRNIGGGNVMFATSDNGDGITSATYLIPDYDYVIALTFSAPSDAANSTLADQVAFTVAGC